MLVPRTTTLLALSALTSVKGAPWNCAMPQLCASLSQKHSLSQMHWACNHCTHSRGSFLLWPPLTLASFINTDTPAPNFHSFLCSGFLYCQIHKGPSPLALEKQHMALKTLHPPLTVLFSSQVQLHMSREWFSLRASTSSSPTTPLGCQQLPLLKMLQA